MTKSDTINELAAALAKAKTAFGPVLKTAENPFYKSKYAPLEAVIEATDAALSANGLSVAQLPEVDGLTTMLMHTSGQYISSLYPVTPVKNDPQGLGSAITYARRYALSAILGVASEPDDDGNAASKPATTPAKPPAPAPAPATPPAKPGPLSPADIEAWHKRWEGYCIVAGATPDKETTLLLAWEKEFIPNGLTAEDLRKLLKTPDKNVARRVEWIKTHMEAK